MIIYGWKPVLLKSELAKSCKCPSCEEVDTTYINIYSRHFHIFWIPISPFGKMSVSYCSNCEVEFKKKDMPQSIRSAFEIINIDAKPPIWQFSGLAIIGGFVLWAAYETELDSKEDLLFLQNPEVGDIYEYEEDNGNYSIMKVSEIQQDTIWIRFNNYEVSATSATYELNDDSCFSYLSIPFTKNRLDSMFQEGTIFDVVRY
ncbi:MAG: hypothetical protein ACJA0Q_001115 [Saprospiraceae bacterium]|jgi:hypothetical protein